MKSVITGAAGQLGRCLVATKPPGVIVRAVDRQECDITDPRALNALFDNFRPDIVINTAAYTAVDAAESNKHLAFAINARGAGNVAEAAARCGARIIQISTDYVFDGNRSTPYPPEAAPAPLNVYGASKLEGEVRAAAAAPDALVIRAGWLYSWHGKNFLLSLMRLIGSSKPLKVVSDQTGCPTRAQELAAIIWKAAVAGLQGTYHWANAGRGSWYDFATEIAAAAQDLHLVDDVPSITAVTSEEYGSPARRPKFSVLDSTKLAALLDCSPLPWREALRQEMAHHTRDATARLRS